MFSNHCFFIPEFTHKVATEKQQLLLIPC